MIQVGQTMIVAVLMALRLHACGAIECDASDSFPGRSWTSSKIDVLYSAPFDVVNATSGVLKSYNRLTVQATGLNGGPIGGCVGTNLRTVQANDATVDVPVYWDVEAPVLVYKVDVAGWVRGAGVVHEAPFCATSQALMLQVMQTKQLTPQESAYEKFVNNAIEFTALEGGGGPSRRLFISNLFDVIDLGFATTAYVMGDEAYTMNYHLIQDLTDFQTRIDGVQSDVVRTIINPMRLINGSVGTHNTAIVNAGDELAIMQAQLDAMRASSSNNSAGIAALETAIRNTAEGAKDFINVTIPGALANVSVTSAEFLRNMTADILSAFNHSSSRLKDVLRALNTSVSIITTRMAELDNHTTVSTELTEYALGMLQLKVSDTFRMIKTYNSRRALGIGLASAFHMYRSYFQHLGFDAFASEGFGASFPIDRAAWNARPDLQAISVDTVYFVHSTPLNGSAVEVIENTLDFVCDPIAGASVFDSVTKQVELMYYIATQPCVIPSERAEAGTEVQKCLCWVEHRKLSCPSEVPGSLDTLVAQPSANVSNDHPRVMTTNGLYGMNGEELANATERSRASRPSYFVDRNISSTERAYSRGYTTYTPCMTAPTVVVPFRVLRTWTQVKQVLDELTCKPLTAMRPIVSSNLNEATGVRVADVYVASRYRSAAVGVAPFLAWVPLWSGLRPTNFSGPSVGTAMYTPENLPRCSLDPTRVQYISGIWPTPLSKFMEFVQGGWDDAVSAFSAAQFAVYGILSKDVKQRENRFKRLGNDSVTCMYASMLYQKGEWVPASVAKLDSILTRAAVKTQRTVLDTEPPVTIQAHADEVTFMDVNAPMISSLKVRFPFLCSLECISRPCIVPGTSLKAGNAIMERYVCNASPNWISLSTQETLRRNTLTYQMNMDTRRPDQWDYNFTQDKWSEQSFGRLFDVDYFGGSVHETAVRVVDAFPVGGGLEHLAIGLSDVVCEGDAPVISDVQALNETGLNRTEDVDWSWCKILQHFVFFTPDLLGKDARFLGTPREACGKAQAPNGPFVACLIPRVYKLTIPSVVTPAGTFTQLVSKACPVVDDSVAFETGYPSLRFRNTGKVSITNWWFEMLSDGTDDELDNLTVDVETRNRLCVNGTLSRGVDLQPGESMVILWAAVCARWTVRISLDMQQEGITTPVQCRLTGVVIRVGNNTVEGVEKQRREFTSAVNITTSVPILDNTDLEQAVAVRSITDQHLDIALQSLIEESAAMALFLKSLGAIHEFDGIIADATGINVTEAWKRQARFVETVYRSANKTSEAVRKYNVILDSVASDLQDEMDEGVFNLNKHKKQMDELQQNASRIREKYNELLAEMGVWREQLSGEKGAATQKFQRINSSIDSNRTAIGEEVKRAIDIGVDVANTTYTMNDVAEKLKGAGYVNDTSLFNSMEALLVVGVVVVSCIALYAFIRYKRSGGYTHLPQ